MAQLIHNHNFPRYQLKQYDPKREHIPLGVGLEAPKRLGRMIGRRPHRARARTRARARPECEILKAVTRSRGPLASEVPRRASNLITRVAGQESLETKIADFGLHIGTEENVGGLEIPMDVLLLVEVAEPTGHPLCYPQPRFPW